MFWILYIFLIGIVIGSFLNVCIYRIPAGESIVKPRSHCMSCGHTLGALELIPVVSYLALGGKCKQCKEKISPRYMIIELLTGIGFVIIYLKFGFTLQAVLFLSFLMIGIVLSMIDWDHMLLPSRIIYLGIGVALSLRILQSILYKNISFLIYPVLGAVIGYILFMLIYYGSKWILKKEGLGYGDVRLMALLGLYIGIAHLFLMIIIACVIAAIYGIVLAVSRKKSQPFPLGPFLNLGALVVILWGAQIQQFYLSLFGL